ncbi:hypothetical protein ACHAWO_006412 [Cyclotella atomus]|uniref:Uncharacterized protein n=1 Tax=Cyclotella atomus TaxID=382360 RepID=A0ABD3PHD5_9STRA
MLAHLAQTSLRATSRIAPRVAPVAIKAFSARFGARFMSSHYAVDAPDGEHDLQDVEESSMWAKRTIDVASVTEDAKAINMVHDAVLGGKQVFAVDAPDGEHDLEDVEEHMAGVERIINEAYLFENPDEVKEQQQFRQENIKEANRMAQHDL